jgi:hypothetical protein
MRSSVILGSEPARRARPAVQPAIPAAAAGPRSAVGNRAVRLRSAGRQDHRARDRITDVSVPVIQTAQQSSRHLASQVIPTLRSEVLSGQTAGIDAVSGATYTSQAYATSLQAPLDKPHLK